MRRAGVDAINYNCHRDLVFFCKHEKGRRGLLSPEWYPTGTRTIYVNYMTVLYSSGTEDPENSREGEELPLPRGYLRQSTLDSVNIAIFSWTDD